MGKPSAMARGGLAQAARQLQSRGRHGDTMLAHINPREAMMLRQAGGSGGINPQTGLPEFFNLGKFLGAIIPIAVAVFAPYLAPAIGEAMMGGSFAGVMAGGTASAGAGMLGGALIGAGSSALSGGNVGQGALAVYRAFQRGKYPMATAEQSAAAGNARVVRLGTYGDPAAVPVSVWETLTSRAVAHTGYTHAWRGIGAGYAHLLMASADSLSDKVQAMAAGFRTFRVVMRGETARVAGEAVCPASAEAGKKLTCITCKACNGTATARKSSIVIQAHGGFAVMANVRKLAA